LVRAEAQWRDLDRLASMASGRLRPPSEASDHKAVARRALLAGGVCSLAAVGLASSGVRPQGRAYETVVGEVRRLALADGSTLILNTDSVARVRFGSHLRKVFLSRGEALFEVAHDAARPFVVHTQTVLVRAIGTVFSVRIGEGDGKVEILVSQGSVAVQDPSATPARPVARLVANQRSVSAPSAPLEVQSVAPQLIERRLAWLDGRVVFDGETLGVAVAELNRHGAQQIVVDDPVLAERPIVGSFRATDPQGFAAAAAAALGADIVAEYGLIHLRLTDSHSS